MSDYPYYWGFDKEPFLLKRPDGSQVMMDGKPVMSCPLHYMFSDKALAEKIGIFNPPGPEKPDIKYLYLIQQEGSNYTKIGVSANPKARLGSLQVGTPDKLSIIELWDITTAILKGMKAFSIEHKVHAILCAYAHHGEWFALPKLAMKQLEKYMASINAERMLLP